MRTRPTTATFILEVCTAVFISACTGSPHRATLQDIDIIGQRNTVNTVFIKPKSEDEIRKAYSDYLTNSKKDDKTRIDAISRLAELEFELASKLINEEKSKQQEQADTIIDHLQMQRLDKTIELLKTSLHDHPKAKGNDKILYQLAKAYDQKGDYNSAIITVRELVKSHPKSSYYLESQFRLAEHEFSARNYTVAEAIYTDIIVSQKNGLYYEKAVFKRGWSRFKQEFYIEAVDDFLETVTYHNFGEYNELSKLDQDQFNEYFRAIGLSFSYLGGSEKLNKYFETNNQFRYLYYTYAHVSDIYRKQHRYSDAVEALRFFNDRNSNSVYIPESRSKIIDIWIEAGFTSKAATEIEAFYNDFNPRSKYWLSTTTTSHIYTNAASSLRNYILLVSEHYHKAYTENGKTTQFEIAHSWYQRYIDFYSSHAQKDNVYYKFAELMRQHGNHSQALTYYEKAAFDSDIILNKEAAYASIVACNRIYSDDSSHDINILDRLVKYSSLFSQLYPTDRRTHKILVNSAQIAYKSRQYSKVIELAELSGAGSLDSSSELDIIKAHSYFSLEQFDKAEGAYYSILNSSKPDASTSNMISDRLALSIYRQAESASKAGDYEMANHHFLRISEIVPQSEIASTGLYDAISYYMSHSEWNNAIANIRRFQSLYSSNKYTAELSKMLSSAYLNSGQSLLAAREFERLSNNESDRDTKIAALWKAAQIYEDKGETDMAIHSYEDYASKYTHPFPQYMEAMYKLTRLYTAKNDTSQVRKWNSRIISSDRTVSEKSRNERSKFIASNASIALADMKHLEFSKYRLVLPLDVNLRKKKQAMQEAVKLYGGAAIYGIPETTTRATHAIADIYESFSKELLSSERPVNLKGEELNQYIILLEDKAFPFEEKSIEFHEINLSRTRDGIYDDWIKKSHARLKQLFPIRYDRDIKMDDYINVLQ